MKTSTRLEKNKSERKGLDHKPRHWGYMLTRFIEGQSGLQGFVQIQVEQLLT
jgi:hypothetical protein